jgi:hypothetical protein
MDISVSRWPHYIINIIYFIYHRFTPNGWTVIRYNAPDLDCAKFISEFYAARYDIHGVIYSGGDRYGYKERVGGVFQLRPCYTEAPDLQGKRIKKLPIHA